MKLCIGSVCFVDASFEDMMARSVRAGFRELELVCVPGWIHADLNTTTPQELDRKVRGAGMELAAIYTPGVQAQDPEKLRTSVDYIKRACDFAQALNVNRVVCTGAPRSTPLQASIDAYKGLAGHIADTNIVIALENHYRNRLETIEDYTEIFRQVDSPNLGITMDTGHFTSSQVDMFALIEALGQKVAHVHLKDHIGTQSVPIGQGETPNAEVISRLKEIGYVGYISLELEVEDQENVDRYVADAWNIMRRML